MEDNLEIAREALAKEISRMFDLWKSGDALTSELLPLIEALAKIEG